MNNLDEAKEDLSNSIETKLSKDKRLECRNIVQTIKEFGVSQRQILFLIQLFALELEDRNIMNSVVEAVKEGRPKLKDNILEVPEEVKLDLT